MPQSTSAEDSNYDTLTYLGLIDRGHTLSIMWWSMCHFTSCEFLSFYCVWLA